MPNTGVKKVPIVLQMEALECGAASLAMICAYYKKIIPLEKLRVDCGVSRDGCNAKNLLLAARSYGLTAKGYSYADVEKLKEEVTLPAIIHWNFNHFVVLCGFKKNKAILADPASGKREVPMDEFNKSFTGITLMFEKTENFVADGKRKSILGFLLKKLNGAVLPLVFILISAFLLAIIGLFDSAFSKIFLDSIIGKTNSNMLIPLLMAMGITAAISFILQVLQAIYLMRVQGKMSVTANMQFMWHVLRMPMEFFAQRMSGEISTRQSSNDTISSTICTQIAPIVLNVVMIIIYFFVLIKYDFWLTMLGLVATLINLGVIKFISEGNVNDSKALARDGGKVYGATASGIKMIETIKSSGCEAEYFQKWIGYQTKYSNSYQKMQEENAYTNMIPEVLSKLTNLAILFFGVKNILDGKFTVGSLQAFQGFMGSFLSPVASLVGVTQTIQQVGGDVEKVEDVMNYEADVDIDLNEKPNENYQKLDGNVDIENLTFGYSPLGAPLIENFDLHVKKGQMVALVGGSGSGKSTIAKVISGLYQPRSGKILFDGKERKDIDRNVFRSSLAMVDQEIMMFQDTIRNNITMWNDNLDEETIIQAAKDAQIHDDILTRPAGYDHELVEGGKDFSGGQRQRFEIARSFVIDPAIMILDEATSALDPTTEKKVMDAVRRRKITCFVVAHRLSTIRDADEIIMLDHGHVVERGTHEELMKLNGKYAELVKSE